MLFTSSSKLATVNQTEGQSSLKYLPCKKGQTTGARPHALGLTGEDTSSIHGHPSAPSQPIKVELRALGVIHSNYGCHPSKARVHDKDAFSSPKPSDGVSKRIIHEDCSTVNIAYNF